jgi:transcriptional regulator
MHPDPHFRWTDRAELRAFVAAYPFGMVFAATPEGPMVAHAPVLWLDDDRIGFHLSRRNRLAKHVGGARALFVANGPHGYVSPDWYGLDDQVPTWNYIAVELEGTVETLESAELPPLIDALSERHEARLAPKPVWTRDKMGDGKFDAMLGAVTGYALRIDQWRGTRKLGQTKPAEARASAADGMELAGDTAIAALMRQAMS